jgi:ABC-type Mn2+/Zn2+ transport system permease subunit
VLGVFAGLVGLYLSYYAGVAAGAAIAGTIVAAYLVVIAWASLRSLGERMTASTEAA